MSHTNDKTFPVDEKAEQPSDDVKQAPPAETAPVEHRTSRRWHIVLLLILGIGTWAFWTYSPIAHNLKIKYLYLGQHQTLEPIAAVTATPKPANPTTAAPAASAPTVDAEQAVIHPSKLVADPLVADGNSYDIAKDEQPTNHTVINTIAENPIQQTAAPSQVTFADISQQLNNLSATMQVVQQQQIALIQYMAKRDIFGLLNVASSPQASLNEAATAWQRITFLPNLNSESRDIAAQAYTALRLAQRDVQSMLEETTAFIDALSQQLPPQDVLKTPAQTTALESRSLMDTNWLDWLKSQFSISKVSNIAPQTQDPYLDMKQIISQLRTLEDVVKAGQWQRIGDINGLIHQLEQHGFATVISPDTFPAIQQTQQHWQQKAAAWMEQL